MSTAFDVIFIGGGPAGYVGAIRAAQHGLKTAVIEKAHMGGICLNWGCIPTKALLRSSEIHTLFQNSEEFGFKIKGLEFDFNKIVQRSRDVSEKLTSGIKYLMSKHKITTIEGSAKLLGKGKMSVVGGDDYTAKHIVLATGARARTLPGLEPDGKLVWSYKEALQPNAMPKKLLVIGSGAIGIEFASFFNALGSDVKVVEIMDRVLPVEDAEISKIAQKQFEAQGLKIQTGAKVSKLDRKKDSVVATIEGKDGKSVEEEYDRVIAAVGVVGNTENLGLENTKVKVERNSIITDPYGKTHEPGVYAVGDVAGPPWLAHKASHEAVICVDKIVGKNNVKPLKKENIPGCTYCTPQVASVGLTEEKAKELGKKIKVGRFPFQGNGKAIALGEPEGLVKTIFDAGTGELLGAHMVGAEVTEMIQGFVIAKELETTEEELMHTIFPHPTLSEMMHESVLDAYDQVIHM